ncbi:MAG: hypothetical protein ACRENU_11995 [Gemmatimonadaceae bacterium]
MSLRSQLLLRVVAIAGVCALWWFAAEPWGLAAYQLLFFMAPGALLGLGTGWMTYASRQKAWSWRKARNAALAGGALLPPVLAFLVALDGNARPQSLLAGFVRAAWIAFGIGLVVAAARALRDHSQQR